MAPDKVQVPEFCLVNELIVVLIRLVMEPPPVPVRISPLLPPAIAVALVKAIEPLPPIAVVAPSVSAPLNVAVVPLLLVSKPPLDVTALVKVVPPKSKVPAEPTVIVPDAPKALAFPRVKVPAKMVVPPV